MPASEYGRRRRAYEAGIPLPRLLDHRARARWGTLLETMLPSVVSDEEISIAARLGPVADAVIRIEKTLGYRPRTRETIINDTRSLIQGRKGALPEKAFALGEALYETDVSWASGLLTLSLAPPFFGHAVAIIGGLLKEGSSNASVATEISQIREGLISIIDLGDAAQSSLNEQTDSFLTAIETSRSKLIWGDDVHQSLRNVWHEWIASKESTKGMPSSFQAYLSLSRSRSNSTIEQQRYALSLIRSTIRYGTSNVVKLAGCITSVKASHPRDGRLAVQAELNVGPLAFDVLFIGEAAETLHRLGVPSNVNLTGYLAKCDDSVQIIAEIIET
jgi:hypothetical protein